MRLCQRNQAIRGHLRYVDSQVGVPWNLMKTSTICPHERDFFIIKISWCIP